MRPLIQGFGLGLLWSVSVLFAADGETSGGIVSNLDARCRHGQVFAVWQELPGNTANLRVYAAAEPITATTLDQATLLTDSVRAHSGNDWIEDPALCPRATGPERGWIIESSGVPLNRDSGLFVHTVSASDPQELYLAVLAQGENAADLHLGCNSLVEPVTVTVAPLAAIAQGNQSAPVRQGMALAVYLHPHTSRPQGQFTHLVFGDKTMGWREGLPFKFKVSVLSDIILLEPYDRVWINRHPSAQEARAVYDRKYKNIETWWYGTGATVNDPADVGRATNYTERLLLWMIRWVQQAYQTDPNLTYGFGASMGTGIQRLGLRHPDVFAGIDLLVPLLDYGYEIEQEPGNIKRIVPALGDLDRICSDGMPLRERLNLVETVCRTREDLPFMIIRIGRQDTSVGWRRKVDYLACMQRNHHGLLAGWDDGDHATAMRRSLNGFPGFRDYRWHLDRLAVNRSYPAFSRYTGNDDPGLGPRDQGDRTGFINQGLGWRVLADEAQRYEIMITVDRVEGPAYVDITPRRRQRFVPSSGKVIEAVNRDSSGAVVQQKSLTVNPGGSITFEGFELTDPKGNSLFLALEAKSN